MPKYPHLLLVCSAIIVTTAAAAAPIGALRPALSVGAVAAGSGALFGASLAAVTRTRQPLVIYLLLLLAGLCLVPVLLGLPPAGEWQIHPWPHAPALVWNYFDIARPLQFFLAVPWPFAALGHHAADVPGNRRQ
ncbi:MAG: hypothetical protein KGJ62_00530 [Armatimonadetes bacterium]|nr:hypothetical protein [Armatimonadota bacterium]MDE2205170.1 hypothetical protein [Armatimonadota bacterium]